MGWVPFEKENFLSEGDGSCGSLSSVSLDVSIHLASEEQSSQGLPHLNVLARVTLGRKMPH